MGIGEHVEYQVLGNFVCEVHPGPNAVQPTGVVSEGFNVGATPISEDDVAKLHSKGLAAAANETLIASLIVRTTDDEAVSSRFDALRELIRRVAAGRCTVKEVEALFPSS